MTYTDAFIDYLTRFDYMENPQVEEYTPSFMDSISDLESELDFCDNIISFPFPVYTEEVELLLA